MVNAEDSFFKKNAKAPRIAWFNGKEARVDGGDLVLQLAKEERYPMSELSLIGTHNQANALAALLLLRASGQIGRAHV